MPNILLLLMYVFPIIIDDCRIYYMCPSKCIKLLHHHKRVDTIPPNSKLLILVFDFLLLNVLSLSLWSRRCDVSWSFLWQVSPDTSTYTTRFQNIISWWRLRYYASIRFGFRILELYLFFEISSRPEKSECESKELYRGKWNVKECILVEVYHLTSVSG